MQISYDQSVTEPTRLLHKYIHNNLRQAKQFCKMDGEAEVDSDNNVDTCENDLVKKAYMYKLLQMEHTLLEPKGEHCSLHAEYAVTRK